MGVMPKRDKILTDFGRNVSRLRNDAGLRSLQKSF